MPAARDDIRITLRRASPISGIVVDSDGAPRQGVRVEAHWTYEGRSQTVQAVTDAGGAFRVAVPAGIDSVRVEAHVPDPFAMPSGFGPPGAMLGSGRSKPGALQKSVKPGTSGLALRLHDPVPVDGSVLAESGRVLPATRVIFSQVDRDALAPLELVAGFNAHDGSFWLRGVRPGRYRVQALANDAAYGMSTARVVDIPLPAGETLALRIARAVALTSTLAGEHIAGKEVLWTAKGSAGRVIQRVARVDAKGTFTLTLPKGVGGQLVLRGGDDDRYAILKDVRAGAKLPAPTWRKGQALGGRVTGLAKHATSWVQVFAVGPELAAWTRLSDAFEFEFRGLPPGRYRLGVRHQPPARGNTRTTGRMRFGASTTPEADCLDVKAGTRDVKLPMPFHVDPGPEK